MQQVTIEWLDLNGKKHTNKIAIPAGHINLSRIDDWFRAGIFVSDQTEFPLDDEKDKKKDDDKPEEAKGQLSLLEGGK